MSEFCCSRGHLMSSGDVTCPECGGKLHTMDGYTGKQIAMMEADYEQEKYNKEADEEDEVVE